MRKIRIDNTILFCENDFISRRVQTIFEQKGGYKNTLHSFNVIKEDRYIHIYYCVCQHQATAVTYPK